MPPFTDPGANRRANEVNPNFYIITNKPLLHYRGGATMTDAAYNAKNWLNRLIDLYDTAEKTRRAIEVCESRINNAVSNYESTGRGRTDPIVRQQQREDALIQYSELKAKYERQYFEFMRQELITINVIDRLEDKRASAVLIDRHINRRSIKEIAKNNYYNLKKSQLHRVYNEALEMLAPLLETAEPQAIQETDIKIKKHQRQATA